ncbi:putative MFS monosaccharide transporter [Microthyrium microscopicum]|uniref:Putative MFS monosaccharide transporter n=1 Tax=Microthyrium microscopicum TaxID=703497 RepID=A0A6A6UQN7_9PEZI|nr:putative MFS monosaccharide transporter [Microthyrium microscopicum]
MDSKTKTADKTATATLRATADVNRIEAPVTIKAYFMCAFAAFGGIFFGYDSGYINGVLAMNYVIAQFTGLPESAKADKGLWMIPAGQQSLIVSILSAGTFIGALFAGDLADRMGRKITIISSCGLFLAGVAMQIAAENFKLLTAGRAIAGLGVGGVSCTIILYMSEIAPRKIRGALVASYQFCITLGLLAASVACYLTQNRNDSGSYRIPIGLQGVWAIILAVGLMFFPESPRYHVMHGNIDKAKQCLAKLRGQEVDSPFIQEELAEIVANHEHETNLMPSTTYLSSWANCFKGGIRKSNSNLRRTILGTSLQMMQQWTGVNFVFYFGTTFFTNLGTIQDPFLISMVTTLVNVCSTPISFWTVERYGRRALLIWGALGMVVCQFIVAIIGTATQGGPAETKVMIAFICIYIFFFASTWGPGAWVVIGEIFPISIRSRGVALSTASNWLWNCIIALITPCLVGKDRANLGAKVFWIWGSLCFGCFLYSYFLVFETKGLSLEQVDQMMEETNPRHSKNWKPTTTFASQMGMTGDKASDPTTGNGENMSDEDASRKASGSQV